MLHCCSGVSYCAQISVLQSMIKEGDRDRDKCLHEVELVVAAAKQIREEVRTYVRT